jgi:hypothetical protein
MNHIKGVTIKATDINELYTSYQKMVPEKLEVI